MGMTGSMTCFGLRVVLVAIRFRMALVVVRNCGRSATLNKSTMNFVVRLRPEGAGLAPPPKVGQIT